MASGSGWGLGRVVCLHGKRRGGWQVLCVGWELGRRERGERGGGGGGIQREREKERRKRHRREVLEGKVCAG